LCEISDVDVLHKTHLLCLVPRLWCMTVVCWLPRELGTCTDIVYQAPPRQALGIFVYGGSSGEGTAQDARLAGDPGVLPQKILNFRSPETQFRAI